MQLSHYVINNHSAIVVAVPVMPTSVPSPFIPAQPVSVGVMLLWYTRASHCVQVMVATTPVSIIDSTQALNGTAAFNGTTVLDGTVALNGTEAFNGTTNGSQGTFSCIS